MSIGDIHALGLLSARNRRVSAGRPADEYPTGCTPSRTDRPHGGRTRLHEPAELARLMLDRLRAGTAGTTPAPETTSLPQTIAESFQRQVEQRPESIAVGHRDRRLSYAQLSSAAKAVASRLVRHGISPGARVGICLDRGPEAIGAILGTLRAACTYVPLDPDYPRARLEAMATRARLSAIISDRVFEQRTPDRFAQALLIPVDPQDMSRQDPLRGSAHGGQTGTASGPSLYRVHQRLDVYAQGGRRESRASSGCVRRLGTGIRPEPNRDTRADGESLV